MDIEQGLLDYINERDKEESISNVQTVLGEFDDPKLPARDIDLAFINDVLHHIEHRAQYLKALSAYIKSSGRIAIIEMDKTDPETPHRNQPQLLLDVWICKPRIWSIELDGLRNTDRSRLSAKLRSSARLPRAQVSVCAGLAGAHVGCRAQPGFEIAATPVPACIDQRRLLRKQFLDAIQVSVRVADKLLYKACFESGLLFHGFSPMRVF